MSMFSGDAFAETFTSRRRQVSSPHRSGESGRNARRLHKKKQQKTPGNSFSVNSRHFALSQQLTRAQLMRRKPIAQKKTREVNNENFTFKTAINQIETLLTLRLRSTCLSSIKVQ